MTTKKMLGLAIITASMLLDATTYTWNSTSSSDLNVADNWDPTIGPPGSGDDAEFDSEVSGIITSPATLSGEAFSISTIDFPHAADVFSITVNNDTLTISGGGIGAAIPNSQTNATISAINVDNTSALSNQIVFSGNPSTSGSAVILASNSGVTTGTTSNAAVISSVSPYQIYAPNLFTVKDGASLTATNAGTNQFNASNLQVGYIGNTQINFAQNFFAGNTLHLNTSNIGTENSTGSGGNDVGFVYDNQIECDSGFTAQDHATITMSNTGSINSNVVGSSNQIGLISGNQLEVDEAFFAVNDLTLTATNIGTNNSSGGSGNACGIIQGNQYYLGGNFASGANTTITASNTGINNGADSSNQTGFIQYGPQFSVNGTFRTGSNLIMTISNTGTDSSSGTGSNTVGCTEGDQLTFNGSCTVGDNATITVSNNGNASGVSDNSQIGVIGNSSSNQITTSASFLSGNALNLTVTNTGIDSSTSSVAALAGMPGQDQFTYQDAFFAGKNLLLTATNIAEGVASSADVGACYNQINFQGTCTIDDGSVISASNEGFGTVFGSQILLENGFVVTSGKVTIAASNSLDGDVAADNIYISGDSLGGNANISLTNASLNLAVSGGYFTIGELNGDLNSTVASDRDLIIDTDQGTSGVFAGAITSAPGLFKRGLGSQTLSGTNTYTGTTVVDGGTLILNGSIDHSMTVNSLGTVKGTGTMGGLLTINGIISPGNSIGTLSVNTYTQNSGSIYDVEVNGSGQSDLIDVTGAATINGGSVAVSSANGTYKFNSPYTILSAASRTGTYTGATAISSMIIPSITYDTQNVYLTLKADIISAARTFNERAVARELDGIANPDALQNTLLSEIVTLSPSDAARALDSVSGWQYTNQELIAGGVNDAFVNRLYDPIRCIVTSTQKCCCCAPCEETAGCCNDYTAWGEIGGVTAKVHGNGNSHTFTLGGWEATIGVQKTFLCDWTIGIAGSFEQDFIHYKYHGGSGESNTCLAGLYALYRPSYFYTFVDFAYGYSFNQMSRSVHVGSLSYKGKSNPNLSQFTFYGEIGGDWQIPVVLIQPFLGVEAGSYSRRQVKEANIGGWALQVNDQSAALAATRLGVHLTAGKLSGKIGSASLDLSWNKRWTGKTTTITEKFVNFGNDFIIKGVNLNSNSFYYALTLAKCVGKHWKIHIKGEGNVWNHACEFDGLAGVAYSW